MAQLITSTVRFIGLTYRTSIDEWLSEHMSANPCLLGSDFPIQTNQVEFATTFSIAWNISLAPHGTWEISEECRDAMLELQKLRPVLAGRLAKHALQSARGHWGRDCSAPQLPAAFDARAYGELARVSMHRSQRESAMKPLTKRESGVLQLIADGLSNKRIAQRLDITPETVKSHAKSIFFKLAAQTRAQAVARADALGII